MSIIQSVPRAEESARQTARHLAEYLRTNPLRVQEVDATERTLLLRHGHAGVVADAERTVNRKRREDREAIRQRRIANAKGPHVVTRFGSQLTTEHDAR